MGFGKTLGFVAASTIPQILAHECTNRRISLDSFSLLGDNNSSSNPLFLVSHFYLNLSLHKGMCVWLIKAY